MVIGLLTIAAIPTVMGVGQAVSAQKKQNAAAKAQEKFHLVAMVPCQQGFRELGTCLLRGGRVRATPHIHLLNSASRPWTVGDGSEERSRPR